MRKCSVQTEEITIRISDRRKMHYLCEAIVGYEMRHLKSGRKLYLPELLLDLQTACQLEFNRELTEACEKQVKEEEE